MLGAALALRNVLFCFSDDPVTLCVMKRKMPADVCDVTLHGGERYEED
jgi:hypothetical protein